MTEFETRVAEALRAIPAKQYSNYAHFVQESEGERFEFWLGEAAPRVAAAIDRVWDNMATGGIDLADARDFALRSLCGESWRGVP